MVLPVVTAGRRRRRRRWPHAPIVLILGAALAAGAWHEWTRPGSSDQSPPRSARSSETRRSDLELRPGRGSPMLIAARRGREGLRVGERVRAWKLFYGLLLYSGNDDARALAFASAGSERAFVRSMNRKAGQLGLRDTHFSNSSGAVDRGNYSSAWDLAALT